MVTGIIIGAAIIIAAIILSFKGICIKYDKTFTIDDKRVATTISPELLEQIERSLNKKANTAELYEAKGPMDNVIAEIQDLFGPGANRDNNQTPRR